MPSSKRLQTLAIALITALLFTLAACSGNSQPENGNYIQTPEGISGTTLVVYSTLVPSFAMPIIEMFEEQYNVTVELYTATTAQTLARLHAEAEAPNADIMWGGSIFTLTPHTALFEAFTSVNEPYMLPGHENTGGVLTSFTTSAGVLIVNTNQIGNIEIRGYECLLNPALHGQIAIAYPSATSETFSHLVNQLYAMGSGNPHAGWGYIEQLIQNTAGIILPDPAAVHAGVINGDFTVGLTCEEALFPYMHANAHIKLVYMEEGITPAQTIVGIVNGAINREGAEAFIDFVTSYEVQAFIVASLNKRAVHSGVSPANASVANTNWIPVRIEYILEHRSTWIEQFWDLWMTHN